MIREQTSIALGELLTATSRRTAEGSLAMLRNTWMLLRTADTSWEGALKRLLTLLSLATCIIWVGCAEPTPNPLPPGESTDTSKAKPQAESTPVTDEQRHSAADKRQVRPENQSIFDPILSELQQKTRVPLRLPTYFAAEEE